nr:CidA/LrgA family protein [Herbinix luporum]
MNYMKQFGIILLVSFLGEVLKHFLSLPIPASIYGLLPLELTNN